ncbi:hypothetical protein [Nocardioides dongxiaopingii]|uniref:hypothetical protein n=1 Tax=Nocardioides dongxiaopingii TaxID=2576036 RepID=UPI0010C761AA|nr:hypothetical protein [Nocardioides dongxiaopingii]
MWNLLGWAAASNEHAIENARAGATECGRRRVERAEVAHYLASRTPPAGSHVGTYGSEHPA